MDEPTREEAMVLLASRTGREVRPFATVDFGRERQAGCVSALIADGDGERLLRATRSALPPGLVAFLGTRSGAAGPPEDRIVELVVGPGESQLDILRLAQTSAPNYDRSTDDLIARLAAIDARYGITLLRAESDTVTFELRTQPDDVRAFADEIYALCPDVVDQGVGSVAELAEMIEITERVYLWWD